MSAKTQHTASLVEGSYSSKAEARLPFAPLRTSRTSDYTPPTVVCGGNGECIVGVGGIGAEGMLGASEGCRRR